MRIDSRVARRLGNEARSLRKAVVQLVHPTLEPRPIFILGCPRSGTKMALRVFERSIHSTIYRRVDARAYVDSRIRSTETIRGLISSQRSRLVVFKPLRETQNARRFLTDFPKLRVIWMLRSVGDVVNSCVRRWDDMRELLQKVVDDPNSAGWFGEGIAADTLQVVRRHYRDDMTLPSAYALFWYLRNQFFFQLELEREESVRVFRYERLVTNPNAEFSKMFEFCDCPFSPDVTREVFGGSIGRDREPEIDVSIRRLCRELENRFGELADHD